VFACDLLGTDVVAGDREGFVACLTNFRDRRRPVGAAGGGGTGARSFAAVCAFLNEPLAAE